MSTHNLGNIAKAAGLTEQDQDRMRQLLKVYASTRSRNSELTKYYDGKMTAREVNIGIAVPRSLAKLRIRCSWATKAVDCLQRRSVFDSYSASDGETEQELARIVAENQLALKYSKSVTSELVHGCSFATLNRGRNGRAAVKFHTAKTSAATWNGEHDRIDCGFVIVDGAKYNFDRSYKPSLVNLHTPESVVVIERTSAANWSATYHPHAMGRPMMEPLVFMPTDEKPFGKSRITEDVMATVDEVIRTKLRMSIASELFTSPKKAILGVTDQFAEDFDKYAAFLTDTLILTDNPQTNKTPQLVQLDASSMEPHIAVLRSLAADFSGSTDVPINELGIIHDNPSSAEAIYAAKESLIALCDNVLNANNRTALYNIGLMALAINEGVALDDLDEGQREFEVDFVNPAMASLVSQADAVTKIASADPAFAGTDTYYKLMGISAGTIRHIQDEKTRNQAQALVDLVSRASGEDR